MGNGNSGGALQHGVQTVDAGFLQSTAQQGVLHNLILVAGLTQALTQLGVVGHGNTLVINDYAGNSGLQLLAEFSHLLLLLL